MAVKQKYAVKCVVGDQDLELSADAGEAFVIKDIQIANPATNYVTLTTQKSTVGFFRVGGPLGSHLPFIGGRSEPRLVDTAHGHTALKMVAADGIRDIAAGDDMQKLRDGKGGVLVTAEVCTGGAATAAKDLTIPTSDNKIIAATAPLPSLFMKTLLGFMVEKGYLSGYPVAEGETFRISGAKQSGAIQLVLYEIYEPADVKNDDPNASKAKEYVFIQYGNSGGNINKTGDTVYSICKTPPEFPDFPFGKSVPAKTEIDVLALLSSDFAPQENDATDNINTKYVKLIKEREVLFDEDRNGILLLGPSGVNLGSRDMVAEGFSLIGNYSSVDMRMPLLFEEGIVFSSGDELLVYMVTEKSGAGKNIDLAEQEIALIQKVRRVE